LIKGKVTKITNFGVFVGLEDGLEGLLHISELSDEKIENPEDLVNVGDELEVKVLRVDTDERKIGLSRKRVDWTPEEEAKAAEKEGGAAGTERVSASVSSTPDANLQGGLGNSGPLIQTAGMKAEAEAEAKAKEEAEAKGEPDELTKVEGIGPKVSELLNGSGIATFQNLADASADSIKETLTEAGGVFASMDPTTWPQQAALAAAGQWDELQTLQDKLDGGKMPS